MVSFSLQDTGDINYLDYETSEEDTVLHLLKEIDDILNLWNMTLTHSLITHTHTHTHTSMYCINITIQYNIIYRT